MLRIKKLMKETHNIWCAVCKRPDKLVKNAQSGKWEYPEPGWALINYTNVCPVCTAKIVAKNKAENERNREKWLSGKEGATNG